MGNHSQLNPLHRFAESQRIPEHGLERFLALLVYTVLVNTLGLVVVITSFVNSHRGWRFRIVLAEAMVVS